MTTKFTADQIDLASLTAAGLNANQLDGFYFTANTVAEQLGYDPTVVHVGVAAQKVKEVMPEIIRPAPVHNNYMTVDYAKLVPLLIEAIKQLSDEVTQLKSQRGL